MNLVYNYNTKWNINIRYCVNDPLVIKRTGEDTVKLFQNCIGRNAKIKYK